MVRRARPHTFKGFLPSLDRVFITQHQQNDRLAVVLGVFWTTNRGSEPAVVLGYCGDPLECWGAGVLWSWGRRLFTSAFWKLPMLEFVDSAISTHLGCISFVLSHQVLEEKGRRPPPPLKAPRSHLVVATPQQSWGLLSAFIPHIALRLYVGVFLSIQCACLNFLLHVLC